MDEVLPLLALYNLPADHAGEGPGPGGLGHDVGIGHVVDPGQKI